MGRRWLFLVILSLVGLLVVVAGFGSSPMIYPGFGWGGMRPWMMSYPAGPWMSPWMMGGYGPYGAVGAAIAPSGSPVSQTGLSLTAADVKGFFERFLSWQGNPRLVVGAVQERDADTIVADIVTKDNSLVQRFRVDRHTGLYRPEEN